MTQPDEDRLRRLWRDQPREPGGPPSVDEVRARARAFRARVRGRLLAGRVAAALAVAWLIRLAFAEADPMVRGGEVAVAVGVLAAIWRLGRPWPSDLPDPAESAETILAFHGREVARQKRSFAAALAAVVPALTGLAVTVAALWQRDPVRRMGAYAPIGALLGLWMLAYWVVHRQRARRLQRELEAMDRAPPR